MQDASLTLSSTTAISTSLRAKALNIFASPGEVFDEVGSAPPNLANWRVPTLLVCLMGMILQQVASIELTAVPSALSLEHAQMLAGMRPLISMLSVCVAAIAGSLWSAFVLWLIGRWILKVRLSYLKTLEVVGLSGMILVLGMIVTALLISASGDTTARPSLTLLAGKLSPGKSRQFLDALNFFHLWATIVMAIGLSKLSKVSFKEAAFWVFGYWLFARLGLVLLA
jgi:hypothetical protein